MISPKSATKRRLKIKLRIPLLCSFTNEVICNNNIENCSSENLKISNCKVQKKTQERKNKEDVIQDGWDALPPIPPPSAPEFMEEVSYNDLKNPLILSDSEQSSEIVHEYDQDFQMKLNRGQKQTIETTEKNDGWCRYFDEKNESYYFYNSKSDESVWAMPPSLCIIDDDVCHNKFKNLDDFKNVSTMDSTSQIYYKDRTDIEGIVHNQKEVNYPTITSNKNYPTSTNLHEKVEYIGTGANTSTVPREKLFLQIPDKIYEGNTSLNKNSDICDSFKEHQEKLSLIQDILPKSLEDTLEALTKNKWNVQNSIEYLLENSNDTCDEIEECDIGMKSRKN